MQSRSRDSVKNRSSSSSARFRSTNRPIWLPTVVSIAQQIRVGLADLAAEELHDPEDLGAPQHGEAERGVQARPVGGRRSREVRIVDDVGNPGGLRGSTTLVPAGRRLPQRLSPG